MKRIRFQKYKKIIAAAACGILILGVAAGILLHPKSEANEDVIWREYPATRSDIVASLDGGGKLEFTKVEHSFSVDLKIKEIFVEVGQAVKKGDKLVEYSKEDVEAKIAECKTALETAERSLQDIKNSQQAEKLTNDLANAQSRQQAQNAYESSKRESENTIQELEQKVKQLQKKIDSLKSELEKNASAEDGQIAEVNAQISAAQAELESVKQQLETQRSTLADLTADYETQCNQSQQNQGIQDQIDSLNNAGKESAVKNAQAEVDKARKNLSEAQSLLDTPILTAETDGIVTAINHLPGEEVPAGRAIVVIGNSQKKHVTISVSQEDIASVEIGQSVELRFSSAPEDAVDGKVIKKSLLPKDGGDGASYEVIISLDKEDPQLLEGMTCSVKFILKKVENVLTLANKAILLRDGKQYVTVKLPDGSHEEREIKTGFSDGRISEVTDGLSDGDIVVVAG